MAYTAKDLVKIFSAIKEDEPIFIAYLTKDDIEEKLEAYEMEDDEGNPIEVSSFITNDFSEKVFSAVGDDDYLWERFNETFNDVVYDMVNEINKEIKEDKELWDTETEKSNA